MALERIRDFRRLDFKQRTHLWVKIDGEIEVVECRDDPVGATHEDFWGSEVWAIGERGYYWQGEAIVTCHCKANASLERELERTFDDACYLQ